MVIGDVNSLRMYEWLGSKRDSTVKYFFTGTRQCVVVIGDVNTLRMYEWLGSKRDSTVKYFFTGTR